MYLNSVPFNFGPSADTDSFLCFRLSTAKTDWNFHKSFSNIAIKTKKEKRTENQQTSKVWLSFRWGKSFEHPQFPPRHCALVVVQIKRGREISTEPPGLPTTLPHQSQQSLLLCSDRKNMVWCAGGGACWRRGLRLSDTLALGKKPLQSGLV